MSNDYVSSDDKEALEMMQRAWESYQALEVLFDVDRIEKVNNDIESLKEN